MATAPVSAPGRVTSPCCVLVDLSGTIHVGNQAISGSISALQRLKALGINVQFISNTTKECSESLLRRLADIGFNIHANELLTALQVAKDFIVEHNSKPLLLLEEDAKKEFEKLHDFAGDPDVVVVGLSPSTLNHDNLTRAASLILSGCPLIAIHKARYFRTAEGLAIGPGGFVAGLEYATGCECQLLGKPQASFFRMVLKKVECLAERSFMIGDDVNDDIKGAQEIGIRGILVKTGKYISGDENKITPGPFSTQKDFAAAVEFMIKLVTMEDAASQINAMIRSVSR